MPSTISHSGCNASYFILDNYGGKRVKCSKCRQSRCVPADASRAIAKKSEAGAAGQSGTGLSSARPGGMATWSAVRRALRAWFRRHRRELPWRETRDPYHVWLSEIMLQQTQVATVVPYFQRFVAALPTLDRLAAATESIVLRLWEGLGYYRRARNLHRAAQCIVREYQGEFPRTIEDAMRLPGIGRYTAGAILSIAFDQRHPVLEANTRRLYARLMGMRGDAHGSAAQRALWSFAEQLLPHAGCGEFNQALMELGALVCTPRHPRCDVCPLQARCAARRNGWQNGVSTVRGRSRTERLREAAVAVLHRGRVLLRQRGDDERWAGLWDFLRFPVAAKRGTVSARTRLATVEARAAELAGLAIQIDRRLGTLRHAVTRYVITLDCYAARPRRAGSRPRTAKSFTWVKLTELDTYPLSTTGRKLAKWIAAEAVAQPPISS